MRVSVPASEEAGSPTALNALANRLKGGRVRSVARHASKPQFIRTSSWFCHMNDGLEQAFSAKKALARNPYPLLPACHSGAPRSGEPGIHKPRPVVMDS